MRFFAKLLLSLEKMVVNPVAWFSNRNWLVRTALVLSLIPAISALSISAYVRAQRTTATSPVTSDDIIWLKKELEASNETQSEQIDTLTAEVDRLQKLLLETNVLGESIDFGSATESGITPPTGGPNTDGYDFVSLNSALDITPVYAEPDTNSTVVGGVEPNELLTFLSEKDNWYQVEFGGDLSGWIQSDQVTELP